MIFNSVCLYSNLFPVKEPIFLSTSREGIASNDGDGFVTKVQNLTQRRRDAETQRKPYSDATLRLCVKFENCVT
jgi:hypothetical protein